MVLNTRLELKVPTVGKTVGLVEMNLASIAMPLVAVAVKVEPPVPMLLLVLDMFTTLEKVNVLLVGSVTTAALMRTKALVPVGDAKN